MDYNKSLDRVCEKCGNGFHVPPSSLLKGPCKYCSQACYRQSPIPVETRFWKKVIITPGCWMWKGAKEKGYGIIRNQFPLKSNTSAHRLSYEIHKGLIPEGLFVCHKCDNPECSNPDHLFVGTHQENMEDMKIKGRANDGKNTPYYTNPESTRGSKNPLAKLNESQVLEIRRRYIPRVLTMDQLAEEYGVSRGAILSVVHRKNWAHL